MESSENTGGAGRDDEAPASLTIKHLSKRFRGQIALDDVDLEIRRGEIHALLGQNGSGKSTLIKVLAGFHAPEPGSKAESHGQRFELGSTAEAHRSGIRFIHQDLALVDVLPVVDNLALGETYAHSGWVSDRRERAAATGVFREYGVEIDVSLPVKSLSPAQRAMVAIVRALHHRQAKDGLLVLDEPTASLPEGEAEHLFSLIRRVREAGGTVLYVTHRLREVFALADRVTILRDGRRVGTYEVGDLDHDRLVELIIGRELTELYPQLPPSASATMFSINGLRGGSIREFSVDIREGEVVGVVGLQGSGVDELLSLVFGATPRIAGDVTLHGSPVPANAKGAIERGVAFAPADRARQSAIQAWTLRENLTLPSPGVSGHKWLSARAEARDVQSLLDQLHVTPADPEARFSALSGGNQQKAVLAKWMREKARVFLLQEPTAGVDVGAKATIYECLARIVGKGACALITTSDFEEACALCDRVIVLRSGTVCAVLTGADLAVDNILREALR